MNVNKKESDGSFIEKNTLFFDFPKQIFHTIIYEIQPGHKYFIYKSYHALCSERVSEEEGTDSIHRNKQSSC